MLKLNFGYTYSTTTYCTCYLRLCIHLHSKLLISWQDPAGLLAEPLRVSMNLYECKNIDMEKSYYPNLSCGELGLGPRFQELSISHMDP